MNPKDRSDSRNLLIIILIINKFFFIFNSPIQPQGKIRERREPRGGAVKGCELSFALGAGWRRIGEKRDYVLPGNIRRTSE